jgi:type II secretory pathway pseudopilin PulG
VVIAIIMVLAGITFGISRGVQNAQARTRAKAELAVLSQGIEQFKLRYGDYPWHKSGESDTNKMLLYALTGRLVMESVTTNGDTVVTVSITESQSDTVVEERPKFIDETKFSIGNDNLLDPWGTPYIYWYKWSNQPEKWDVFGFHLYSTGPNGESANEALKDKITDEDKGVLDNDFRDTANAEGIIFAGE